MPDHMVDVATPIPIGADAVLRHWRDADASAVAAACNDPGVARWIPVPQPYTVGEALRYIEQTRIWWRDGQRFVLCVDENRVAVGSLSLRLEAHEPAIGWRPAPVGMA